MVSAGAHGLVTGRAAKRSPVFWSMPALMAFPERVRLWPTLSHARRAAPTPSVSGEPCNRLVRRTAVRNAPTAAPRAAPQARHVERWLACARRAFAELDPDGDGVAQADDIVACLRAKLPPSEARSPAAALRCSVWTVLQAFASAAAASHRFGTAGS